MHQSITPSRLRLHPTGMLFLLLLLCFPESRPAYGDEKWTSPAAGICYLTISSETPSRFHILKIDLQRPGVALRLTPASERWQTTSQYARKAGLAAAINGGAWTLFRQQAQGLAAGNGTVWSNDITSHGVFMVLKNNRALIHPPERPEPIQVPVGLIGAVSGRPMLVEGGKIAPGLDWIRECGDARTAVGVSRNGRIAYLIAVDGRSPHSAGAGYRELARLFIALGAYDALNLDGGNSVSMYVAEKGGLVNRPSRGWEREVVNHIGVVAPASPQAISHGRCSPELEPLLLAPGSNPLPIADRGIRGMLSGLKVLDLLFAGKHREWMVPLGLLLTPLVIAGLPAVWLYRTVSRRRGNKRRLPS